MSDLLCPECGKPDAVPTRAIERTSLRRRWWLVGELVAVTRKVGKVHRCAHCALEYCTGPNGSYVPVAAVERNGGQPRERAREEPPEQRRVMRDADQRGWD